MKGTNNVQPRELHRLRTMHLFSGAGGGILADILLGHVPVCAVEIDHYCRQVLDQRQADGCVPWFPIFDDVRTFDGRPWRGVVDIVAGGFPCQDISAAGKGAGIDGERSGLWREMARIIGEVRPRFAFVENSPMLTSRGLGRVCGDLAEMGYDATWGVVSAADAGAWHLRKRCWIVAYAKGERLAKRRNISAGSKRPHRKKAQSRRNRPARRGGDALVEAGVQWTAETVLLRTSYVVANRVDAIKAIGNGQVPAVAALAWRILTGQVS